MSQEVRVAQGQVCSGERCTLLLEALLLQAGSLVSTLEISVYLSHHSQLRVSVMVTLSHRKEHLDG